MKPVRIILDPFCPDTQPIYGTRYGGGPIERLIRRWLDRPTARVPVFYRVETETEIQIRMSPKNVQDTTRGTNDR